MLRREFLKSSILVVGGACLPIWTIGASAQVRHARTLILLELKGGNDGINTIVPYTDPAYQSARPGLAFKRGEVLHASDRLGFHKALAPLWPAWEAGELAWVLGLGYAAPNRSHFRSIEIWDTASASNEVLDTGWLAQLLKERTTDNPLPQGLVLGDGDPGPLLGEGVNVVSIQELEPFFSGSRRFEPGKPSRTTSAALHRILEVRSEVFGASSALRSRLDGAQDYAIDLPQGDLKAPLELLGRLLV